MTYLSKRTLVLAGLYFFIIGATNAQSWLDIRSVWDDSCHEWQIFSDSLEGKLEVVGFDAADIVRWNAEWDEYSADIQMKWRNDPSFWELNGGGYLITARQKWKRDKSEWSIICEGETFTWKSKYPRQYDEWFLLPAKQSQFAMYTEVEQDIRDWLIEDYLPKDEKYIYLKMMLSFLAIINSCY